MFRIQYCQLPFQYVFFSTLFFSHSNIYGIDLKFVMRYMLPRICYAYFIEKAYFIESWSEINDVHRVI